MIRSRSHLLAARRTGSRAARPLAALLALLLAALPAATAQEEPPALDLSAAQQLAADASADVATARLDLSTARADLVRAEADPLALRVPLLQARQALELAELELDIAILEARDAAASAYTDALEAEDGAAIAARDLELAETRLDATRIRASAGAATRIDVERAQNDLASSRQALTDARQSLRLARDRLESAVGVGALPETLPRELPSAEVPSLNEAIADIGVNLRLVQARHGVELAEAQFAAVDNRYSARADVDAAEARLEAARVLLADLQRSLALTVRQAHNLALAAEGRLATAEAALATAGEELEAQRVRFDAGSVSRIELADSEQASARAEANRDAARFALLAALRQLELTVRGSAGGAR